MHLGEARGGNNRGHDGVLFAKISAMKMDDGNTFGGS